MTKQQLLDHGAELAPRKDHGPYNNNEKRNAHIDGFAAAVELLWPMVVANKYYAVRNSWSIVEDYDGYIETGLISHSDQDKRPKEECIGWNYEEGGKLARQALSDLEKKVGPNEF